MELHKAIKSVIDTDGIEIIKDPLLVNILSDLQAFERSPAFKYILRAVIVEGYAQKLLSIGTWNDKSENLCSQFVTTTGFQYDFVYEVFQSMAYGLGYLSSVSNNPTNGSKFSSAIADTLCLRGSEINKLDRDAKNDYRFAAEKYLDSIIEIKGDWEKDLGIKIRVTSKYEIYASASVSYDVIFNIEVNGYIKPIPGFPEIEVSIIVYGRSGGILAKVPAYIGQNNLGYDVVSSFFLSENDFGYVGNIRRIVVYY